MLSPYYVFCDAWVMFFLLVYKPHPNRWKARKFSTEKPEKTVLFISDGILSWPVAASAVKEEPM